MMMELVMFQAQPIFSRFSSRLFFIVLTHCLVFSLIAWLILPNMDIDMFENYAWGQRLEWGSFKHPPLFFWVTRLWFSVWPTTHWSYFFLSYFNAALGLWGVLCLARFLFNERPGQHPNPKQYHSFLLLVLGFSVLSLPFNLYAAVFNADSILLSLWPWTTFVFFRAIHSKERIKQWLWAFLLGLFSAACVLGKYFSVVLLLTLFILSLSTMQYRRWYKTPFPYFAFVLFVAMLLPHAIWEYQMQFPFRGYYSKYLNITYGRLLKNALVFLITGVYFFALSWISWGFFKKMQAKAQANSFSTPVNHYLLLSLSLFPVFITILLSLVSGITLKNRWAIPAWFALPILMANQLAGVSVLFQDTLNRFKFFWLSLIAVIGVLFVNTVWFSYSFLEKQQDYLEARKEMVLELSVRFQNKYPKQVFSWVGGTIWPDTIAPFAFYLPNHPRALPGFPDQMPALASPHPSWYQEYGAILCGKKYSDSTDVIDVCIKQTKAWLKQRQLPIHQDVIKYHAKGWRWHYLPSQEREVIVFWIKPKVATL